MVVGAVSFVIYQKVKNEASLNDDWWKVKWADLAFPEKQVGKRSTLSLGLTDASFSRASKTTSALSLVSSMGTTSKNITGALVAMYKVGGNHSDDAIYLLFVYSYYRGSK